MRNIEIHKYMLHYTFPASEPFLNKFIEENRRNKENIQRQHDVPPL